MNLHQFESGYRYTSDAMVLYDFICKQNPNGNVLDVGSGCGILGLLIKRDFPSICLTQIDIQEEHIFLTQKNAQENEIQSSFILGDFNNYNFDCKFDFIISNPPYYHEETKKSTNERLAISRYADSLPLNNFLTQSYRYLNTKGSLIFCYDATQICDVFHAIKLSKLRLTDICFVHSKVGKDSILILIKVKKDSNAFTKVHSPIFMSNELGYTDFIKNIFKRANTKSISCIK